MPQVDMEVIPGMLLCRIAPESAFRITLLTHPSDLCDKEICDIWKTGSFVSLGEVAARRRTVEGIRNLSLKLLDQFAPVEPGMAVEVRCGVRDY